MPETEVRRQGKAEVRRRGRGGEVKMVTVRGEDRKDSGQLNREMLGAH